MRRVKTLIAYDVKPRTEPGQPVPDPGSSIPAEVQPWAWVAVAYALRDDVAGPLRQMPDAELRHMAASIGLYATILPQYLAQWDLPPLEGPGFWAGAVLPAIRIELERRSRPKRTWGTDSPIAQLKRLDIVDVARRFTELTGHGDRLKARCPLHEEKTPSFYIYSDSQKWHCFGACGQGGDVVDLVRLLRDRGRSV